MALQMIPNDVHVLGSLSCTTLIPPANSIDAAALKSAQNFSADKMSNRYVPGTGFALAIGGTPATREEIVHVAKKAGAIKSFQCTLNEAGSSTNIDFDLKVNGVTVLSAAVNFVHGDGDRTVKSGAIATAAYAASDVLSIAMTVTSATGAQGPWAWAEVDENGV